MGYWLFQLLLEVGLSCREGIWLNSECRNHSDAWRDALCSSHRPVLSHETKVFEVRATSLSHYEFCRQSECRDS